MNIRVTLNVDELLGNTPEETAGALQDLQESLEGLGIKVHEIGLEPDQQQVHRLLQDYGIPARLIVAGADS